MVDQTYKLVPINYVLCGKDVEVTEDTTTLGLDTFDKRVTLSTWQSDGKWLVMPALATKRTYGDIGITGFSTVQRPGPAPLACTFDTEEQAREWCALHDLTIVSQSDRHIACYELE